MFSEGMVLETKSSETKISHAVSRKPTNKFTYFVVVNMNNP